MSKKEIIKHKTKNIKPKEPDFSKRKKELRKEISELEQKRSINQKGFKGFIQKAALNKAIKEKRAILQAHQRAESIGHQTKMLRQGIEYEKAKNELAALKKKNQVDFSGLGGFESSTPKPIKYEDIFK